MPFALTFTIHTLCFIQKGSKADTHTLTCKSRQSAIDSFFSSFVHTHAHSTTHVCVMRQTRIRAPPTTLHHHTCTQTHMSLSLQNHNTQKQGGAIQSNTHAHGLSLNQHSPPPVCLVLQKCGTSSVFPPLGVLQLCTKPALLNLPQLLPPHTELLWNRRRRADTQ